MTGYITKDRLSRILTVPFNLPQTRVPARSSVIVATIRLNLGQMIRLRAMHLHVPRVLTTLIDPVLSTFTSNDGSFTYTTSDEIPSTSFSKLIDHLGLVYAGLFAGDFSSIREPTGSPIAAVNASSTGIYALSAGNFYDLSSPDLYHIMVVNNTDSLDMDVVVSGAFRVYDVVQSPYEVSLDNESSTGTSSNAACICCSTSSVSLLPPTIPTLPPVNIAPIGSVTVYSSVEKTASCSTGTTGSNVTVPAGAILSTISQADADNRATALAQSQLVCVPVSSTTSSSSGGGGSSSSDALTPNVIQPSDITFTSGDPCNP